MKNFTLKFLKIIILLLFGMVMNAQTAGFNSTFAVLSINGGANTYYDLQASTGNPDFQGANLGNFTTSNSLILRGAEHNVFKCGGCDLTSTRLYYRVFQTGTTPGSFNNLNIGFFSGFNNGCGGADQQWANTGLSVNMLTGLTPGNYTFEVYSDASVTCQGGTIFAGNFGLNYKATFNFCGSPTGPLSPGNYSIPGCFATVNAAATYLNTNGVTGTGTIQFDVAAGHVETAPVGGILLSGIGTPGNLATGTSTTEIVFKKSGVGANPRIIAPVITVGNNFEGIVKIIGSDYITFDGFTLQENPSNTIVTPGTANRVTEVGFGLFLGSATNGAQNNTIKNCTITLNENYTNSIGIFSTSASNFAGTTLAATSTAGTNSFNTFSSNTISNVAYGIYLIAQPVTSTIQETGNVIGGSTPAMGNTITFGNATLATATGYWSRFYHITIAGIVYRNGADVTIQNNTVNSYSLAYSQVLCSGIAITSTGTGGVVPSVAYTASVNNNTISIINNGAAGTAGIDFGHGLLNSNQFANSNIISIECGSNSANSNIHRGIRSSYASLTNEMNNNSITINQSGAGPYSQAVFFIDANGRKVNLTMQNNLLQSTGGHIRTSNITNGIAHNGGVTGTLLIGGSASTANTINISRGTPGLNFVYGIVGTDINASPTTFNIDYNIINLTNLSGSCLGMGIYNFEGNSNTVKSINNNTITITGTHTGISNGLFLSNGIITAANNTINVSTNSVAVTGIEFTINGTINQGIVTNNNITLATSAINPIMRGIGTSVTTVINGFTITDNSIDSITATANSGTSTIYGIRSSIGTNNVISGNTIKNITTAAGTTDALISGIDLSGTLINPNVFNNKIHSINCQGSGSTLSVNGISIITGTTTFSIYNNIISDLNAPFANSVSAINGIGCAATNSTYLIYYNTIKLGTSSPLTGGVNFGVKGINIGDNASTTILDLRNNIININSTPSGIGYSSCVAIAFGTANSTPLGFATSSNNNIYHINSNANNFIFAQGLDTTSLVNGYALSGLTNNLSTNINNDVNFNTPCSLYKTFMGGTLDSLSFTEDNLIAGSMSATFNPSGSSYAENGAQTIPLITTDFMGVTRIPTNDIGALQFNGTSITTSILTASVSISAVPSGPICAGTSVTFTATPTNGGTTPFYQWQINGNNVPSQNGVSFTTTSLANNDSVTVVMTSSETCVLGSPATSAPINVTVNPFLTPSVAIVASPSGQVPVGSSVTFTATPTNGGPSPTYQWQINGIDVLGEINPIFTTTSLVEGDVVTVVMTSNYSCLTIPQATSNSIIMDLIYPFDTNVIPTQCGSTLATINQNIFAVLIPPATGYRFRITDLLTNQVQIATRTLRVIQLTQLPSYAFDRTYKIEVAARVNNVWQPYGNPCNVTTPIPISSLINCNGTMTLINEPIYAINVPFSIGYRFKVTNTTTSAVEIIDRTIRDLRLTFLSNPQYNTTYAVEVAVRNTDGNYMPFGPSCTITSPPIPTTQITSSQCNSTQTLNSTLFATPFSGASIYRFKFENSAMTFSTILDRPVSSIVLNTVPGLQPGQTYLVSVAVEVGTVFGPFGTVCNITIPPAAKNVNSISEFSVIAFPNPFNDGFKLDVSTTSKEEINIKVYDMLGKLVENRMVASDLINEIELGTNHPSGIYNVIVNQGIESKTMRVVKR